MEIIIGFRLKAIKYDKIRKNYNLIIVSSYLKTEYFLSESCETDETI